MKVINKIVGLLLLSTLIVACNESSTYLSQQIPNTETTIKKDISEMDLALCFDYSKDEDRYQTKESIDNLFLNDLPTTNDILELNVKFTLTDTAKNVKGKFIFTDDNYNKKESEEVTLAVNTKNVSGTIKGKSPINAKHVSFMIIAEIEEEKKGKKMLIAENGQGYGSEGKYFSLIPDEKGIKIKLADNVKIAQWQGGWISIKDSKFRININYVPEDQREFLFPFVEKDKKTYVQLCASINTGDSDIYSWQFEINSCVAGGGFDISEYLDYDAFKDSTAEVTYNPETGFECAYKISRTNVIKNSSTDYPISYAVIDYNLLLGEPDWSHSYYLGYVNVVDLLNEELKNINSYTINKHPSLEIWKEYGYKYTLYVTPEIKFADYPEISLQLDFASIFSPETFYNPNI